jgi:hypothetical protein
MRWPLLVALLLAPAAAAHGGAPVREIDSLLLADDEGLYDYGGCTSDQCAPSTEPAGIDLLGLDAREAHLPGGTPCLVLYASFQTEDRSIADRAIQITFNAGGTSHSITVANPAAQPASTEAALVKGPDDIGDGFPQAIEVWITYDQMGVSVGDRVTDIRVQSLRQAEPDDEMPGTWYSQGQRMPHVPHSPDPGDLMGPMTPGTRTLTGPASLIRMDQNQYVAKVNAVNLTASTVLSQMDQFVTATAFTPRGTVSIQPSQFILAASQTRTLEFTATGLEGLTNITVVLESDLGARQAVTVLASPPRTTETGLQIPGDEKSTPLPWILPLLALVLVIRLRR